MSSLDPGFLAEEIGKLNGKKTRVQLQASKPAKNFGEVGNGIDSFAHHWKKFSAGKGRGG